jgi:hypothetical protein
MIATVFIAICCAVAVWDFNHRYAPPPLALRVLSVILKISLPAGAFGTLLGRPWFGVACGLVGAASFILLDTVIVSGLLR